MSYLRDEGGGAGAGGTEEGETGVLLTTAKLSPTTCGHFSGTFLHVSGSEGAGGWRCQPLSDVDSVEKKVHRQGAGYRSPSNNASLQQVTVHDCYVNIRSLVHHYKHLAAPIPQSGSTKLLQKRVQQGVVIKKKQLTNEKKKKVTEI